MSNVGVSFTSSNLSISITMNGPPIIVTSLHAPNTNIVTVDLGGSPVSVNTINTYSVNTVNLTVLSGGGYLDELKNLADVQSSNVENGYVLTVNTHGTANTTDDTYYFGPETFDGGNF